MDDLIYILALVAWVAYAFYKNSKKVKQNIPGREPEHTANDPQRPDFKSILEEMLLGQETTAGPARPGGMTERRQEYTGYEDSLETIPTGSYETYEKQSLDDTVSMEVLDPERNVMYNYDETAKEASPVYSEENATEESYREVFNLRRAVIYSAVLNRPYA